MEIVTLRESISNLISEDLLNGSRSKLIKFEEQTQSNTKIKLLDEIALLRELLSEIEAFERIT